MNAASVRRGSTSPWTVKAAVLRVIQGPIREEEELHGVMNVLIIYQQGSHRVSYH